MSLRLRESSGGACPFSTAQCMQEVKPATTLGHRVYVDAAACPCAPRRFFVGYVVIVLWRSEGPVIRRCPHRVNTQQAAELFRVPCALDGAWSFGSRHVDLVMDNVGTIAQVMWGRPSTLLVAQQRILCRVVHRLRWQGVSVGLRFVESAFNLVDCVNRWASGGRGAGMRYGCGGMC